MAIHWASFALTDGSGTGSYLQPASASAAPTMTTDVVSRIADPTRILGAPRRRTRPALADAGALRCDAAAALHAIVKPVCCGGRGVHDLPQTAGPLIAGWTRACGRRRMPGTRNAPGGDVSTLLISHPCFVRHQTPLGHPERPDRMR